jgi:hypothetical protein
MNLEDTKKNEVIAIVKRWLEEEGYSLTIGKQENVDTVFEIQKANFKITIGFHNESKDSLIIGEKVHFDPNEQVMLRYTTTKRDILFDLEIIFTILHLDISFKPNFKKEEFTIEDIQLFIILYFDGLTKQFFYDELTSVFNALKLLIMKFNLLGRQGG